MKGVRKYPDREGRLSLAEGEYGKSYERGGEGIWFARPPGSHMGDLRNHTVVEHEDRTISVTPSILIDDGRTKWHGYLTNGVWIQSL
jgi:hypothetical protein